MGRGGVFVRVWAKASRWRQRVEDSAFGSMKLFEACYRAGAVLRVVGALVDPVMDVVEGGAWSLA
eukprot:6190326-Pleurochrysis_carterae.AAC.3